MSNSSCDQVSAAGRPQEATCPELFVTLFVLRTWCLKGALWRDRMVFLQHGGRVCVFHWQVVPEDRHRSWRSMTVGAEIPVIEPLAIDLHQWYIAAKYSWVLGVPAQFRHESLDEAVRRVRFSNALLCRPKSQKAPFERRTMLMTRNRSCT